MSTLPSHTVVIGFVATITLPIGFCFVWIAHTQCLAWRT